MLGLECKRIVEDIVSKIKIQDIKHPFQKLIDKLPPFYLLLPDYFLQKEDFLLLNKTLVIHQLVDIPM